MSFRDTLQSWHDFYVTSGAASTTLAGLLFVGLSLHLRIVVTHPEVRSLARITLSNYFVILLVSLFLLTYQRAQAIRRGACACVRSGTALMTPSSVSGIRARRARTLRLRVLISRFGMSMLAYLALGVMGVSSIQATVPPRSVHWWGDRRPAPGRRAKHLGSAGDRS